MTGSINAAWEKQPTIYTLEKSTPYNITLEKSTAYNITLEKSTPYNLHTGENSRQTKDRIAAPQLCAPQYKYVS